MRKFFFFLVCLCASVRLSAAPAYPFPVTIVQSDGTELTIVGHGDEDFHYITTTDNVLLVQEGRDYFVGRVDERGRLVATRQLAHEPAMRSAAERQLVLAQNHERFLSRGETLQRKSPRREPIAQTGTLFPHTGSPKAIVILAEFADTTFSLPAPRASFDQYLNSMEEPKDLGNGEDANTSSVRHYFKTMSGEQFEPQFDVYGPVTLPNPLKTYGGTAADGAGENMSALLRDACTLMDDSLDFSQYDADGDGNVDLVYVIYAGFSESVTNNSNQCIWPKSGTVNVTNKFDGMKVARYGVSSELNGFPNAFSSAPFRRINGIGVFCHEFSHCMGLPDLYPTTKSSKDNNQSMEYWSLMDLGEYLYNGWAPSEYTAWERECFGWTEIPELDASLTLDIKPLSQGGTAYRISNENDPTGHDYYIVENIQKVSFNWSMKGHGLVVTHVNYDPSAFTLASNSVNNEKGKPRMTVVPADGLLFSNKYVDGKTVKNADFYAQLAGDPFPGTSDVRELNADMPNVGLWVMGDQTTAGSISNPSVTGDALSRLAYVIANIREDDEGVIHLNEVPTGISEIGTTTTASSPIYTLDGRYAGRDLNRLHKGVYLKDGKKVIVR